MSVKINTKYLENYALEYSMKVCDQYFSSKKYMTGAEILKISSSKQINFFVIKTLFETWHTELDKLKSNSFFDYRDNNVHRVLNEFMNVLSRSIKIDRTNFEPLLVEAVAFSILLALEPLSFFKNEFKKTLNGSLNDFLKENKKYYRWHVSLIENIIDRAGIRPTKDAYMDALVQNYEQQKDSLISADVLLSELRDTVYLDFDNLFEDSLDSSRSAYQTEVNHEEKQSLKASIKEERVVPPKDRAILKKEKAAIKVHKSADSSRVLDPLQFLIKFEAEQYSVMKGTIGQLSDSIGINQRFMFTKELFGGDADLMKMVFSSIDQCKSFMEAVQMINDRYVEELDWDKDSEPIEELLQLIFRKFE